MGCCVCCEPHALPCLRLYVARWLHKSTDIVAQHKAHNIQSAPTWPVAAERITCMSNINTSCMLLSPEVSSVIKSRRNPPAEHLMHFVRRASVKESVPPRNPLLTDGVTAESSSACCAGPAAASNEHLALCRRQGALFKQPVHTLLQEASPHIDFVRPSISLSMLICTH